MSTPRPIRGPIPSPARAAGLAAFAGLAALTGLTGCSSTNVPTHPVPAAVSTTAPTEAGAVPDELPSIGESLGGDALSEPFHPTDEPAVRWRAELRATAPRRGEPAVLRVDELVQSGLDFRITRSVDGRLLMEQRGSGADLWMWSPLWERQFGADVWVHLDFADPAQAQVATDRIGVPHAGLVNWWPVEVGEARDAPAPGASGLVTAVDRADPRRTVIDLGDRFRVVITRETLSEPRPVAMPTDRPIVPVGELDELAGA